METRRYIRQLSAAGALAASFTLATGSPASAGGCSSNVSSGGGSSAVQQYVEQLPTACGNQASKTGTHETKLPKSIEQKIDSQAGSQAPILKKIATSEAYGAPQRTIKAQRTKTTKHYQKILGDAEKHSNAVSASFGVVTDGSDARLLTLLIVMIGTAVAVVGTAVRRRRGTR